MKFPEMQKVLDILQKAEPEFTGDLQIVLSDLKKHHMEAQDNAKFLSTLERHLKVPVLEKTWSSLSCIYLNLVFLLI